MEDKKLKIFQKMYNESNNIVFFGGAGVSTESGIPDFRSVDGLYNQKWKYPPEVILSYSFFQKEPEEFYKFYKEKLLLHNIKPNNAHLVLAKMEKAGKIKAIITQNIDGLHKLAGSINVFELHGTILNNYCVNCKKFFDINYIENSIGAPHCNSCDYIIKPDVVLYEEPLNQDIIIKSINAIEKADMLIIAGTSLSVFPAASFINYFKGKYLVVINKTSTKFDINASLVINDKVGEVLSKIKV